MFAGCCYVRLKRHEDAIADYKRWLDLVDGARSTSLKASSLFGSPNDVTGIEIAQFESKLAKAKRHCSINHGAFSQSFGYDSGGSASSAYLQGRRGHSETSWPFRCIWVDKTFRYWSRPARVASHLTSQALLEIAKFSEILAANSSFHDSLKLWWLVESFPR